MQIDMPYNPRIKRTLFKTRAKIIIGRSGDDKQLKAIRSLNGHLMRIEILTSINWFK